jgi:hypothetical protein
LVQGCEARDDDDDEKKMGDLNQFFAAIGTNYFPQVQSKLGNFVSPTLQDPPFGNH